MKYVVLVTCITLALIAYGAGLVSAQTSGGKSEPNLAYAKPDDPLLAFKVNFGKRVVGFIKKSESSFPIKQFSICIKLKDSKVDTAFVSINAGKEIMGFISREYSKLDYTNLLAQAKLNQWKDVSIVLPCNVVYVKKPNEQSLSDLSYVERNDMVHQFSYNLADNWITNVILLNPMTILIDGDTWVTNDISSMTIWH